MLTLNLDLCHAHVRLCCVVCPVRRFLCAHAHEADVYTNVCTLGFRYLAFLNHSCWRLRHPVLPLTHWNLFAVDWINVVPALISQQDRINLAHL